MTRNVDFDQLCKQTCYDIMLEPEDILQNVIKDMDFDPLYKQTYYEHFVAF